VSELHQRWSAYELREQWVAEQFWPSGGSAGPWLAELIGLIVGQRIDYHKETEQRIRVIVKMLDGTFDPDKDVPKRGIPGPEQMKMLW
jgi:hypothetical protein